MTQEFFTPIETAVREAESRLASFDSGVEVQVPVRIDMATDMATFFARLLNSDSVPLAPDDRTRVSFIRAKLSKGFDDGGGQMTMPYFSASDLDFVFKLAKDRKFRKQREGLYPRFAKRLGAVVRKHNKLLEETQR